MVKKPKYYKFILLLAVVLPGLELLFLWRLAEKEVVLSNGKQ